MHPFEFQGETKNKQRGDKLNLDDERLQDVKDDSHASHFLWQKKENLLVSQPLQDLKARPFVYHTHTYFLKQVTIYWFFLMG